MLQGNDKLLQYLKILNNVNTHKFLKKTVNKKNQDNKVV